MTIASKLGRVCGACFQQSRIRLYIDAGQGAGHASSSPPRTIDITSWLLNLENKYILYLNLIKPRYTYWCTVGRRPPPDNLIGVRPIIPPLGMRVRDHSSVVESFSEALLPNLRDFFKSPLTTPAGRVGVVQILSRHHSKC